MASLISMIFSELCINVFTEESRAKFLEIAGRYPVDAVILGCTELGMLIDRSGADLPLFDTTVIHAVKAAELALDED